MFDGMSGIQFIHLGITIGGLSGLCYLIAYLLRR